VSESAPFEEAGRQRKAFLLINTLRDLGLRSTDLAPQAETLLADDAWWNNVAGLAGCRPPSQQTRSMVLRLLPVGECPSELTGPRHDMTGDSGKCRGCGYDPFAAMAAERAAIEDRA
jgi:hypothetical protein